MNCRRLNRLNGVLQKVLHAEKCIAEIWLNGVFQKVEQVEGCIVEGSSG